MSRPRLYIRKFLNKPGYNAGAYILVEVQDTSRQTDDDACAWVEFKLSDCLRKVELDFDLRRGDRANSLHKARLLLDTLTRFVEALEAEAALAEQRERTARSTKRAS